MSSTTLPVCPKTGSTSPSLTVHLCLHTALLREIGNAPVGLYLNPPDHAMVLCVDEKSQIQALNRTQPTLPMGLGYVEGYTHDYVRHGTTTLFAALDIATRKVLAQCRKRHRHEEFLAFLRLIDREVPAELDIHLVLDNYATHKHAKVRQWLAARPALPPALHAHLLVLVEPGGAVVRLAQPAGDQAGLVPQRRGSGAQDPGVHRQPQYLCHAVRLGRHGAVDSSTRSHALLCVFPGQHTRQRRYKELQG